MALQLTIIRILSPKTCCQPADAHLWNIHLFPGAPLQADRGAGNPDQVPDCVASVLLQEVPGVQQQNGHGNAHPAGMTASAVAARLGASPSPQYF